MRFTYQQKMLLLFSLLSAVKTNELCKRFTTAYFNNKNKMVAKKPTNNCQPINLCYMHIRTLQACETDNATFAHPPWSSLLKTIMQHGGYEAEMDCSLLNNGYSVPKECSGDKDLVTCQCMTADCYTATSWDMNARGTLLTPRIVTQMYTAVRDTKVAWVDWKRMPVTCPTTTALFTAYSELAFKHKTGECGGDGQTRCKTVFAFFDDTAGTRPSSADAVRSSFSALTAGYSVVQSCDVGHAYPNVSKVFQKKPFGLNPWGGDEKDGSYDYPYCYVDYNVTSAAPRITCVHQRPGFDSCLVHTVFINGTVFKPGIGVFKDLHDVRPTLVKLVSSNPGAVRNESLLFTTTTTTPTTTTISTAALKQCLNRSAFFSRDTTLVLKDAARTCLGRACHTVYGLITERRLDELATTVDAGAGLRRLLTDGFTVVQSCADRAPPAALDNVCRLENDKAGASPTICCVCSAGGSDTCREVISLGFGAGSVARLPTQHARRQMMERVHQDRLAYTHDDLKPNGVLVTRAQQPTAVAAALFVLFINAFNLAK